MATTYQGSYSGSGQLTFQSSSHPVYQVTVNGTTTANVTFSVDQKTFTATETSSATAHFHVIADSTGGFQDFDANETDTRSLSGSVNNVIGLLISTSDATANFGGAFSSDLSQITGNATLTFSGFDGSVGIPMTLNAGLAKAMISIDSGTLRIGEKHGPAHITLSRSFDLSQTSSVDVLLVDGTATSPTNYFPGSGVNPTHVVFSPGQSTADVFVGIMDDFTIRPNLDFEVRLINPSNATLGANVADITIVDEDQPANYPPLPLGTLVISANTTTFTVPNPGPGSVFLASAGAAVHATISNVSGNHIIYAGPLTGGVGNKFVAGSGVDTYMAGSGTNTYVAGTGTTIVDYSLASGAATVNLSNGTETGAFIGSDVLNNIHNVAGSPFADTFIGSSTADAFNGGAGDDKFTGGLGNDAIDGGPGSDTAIYSGPRSSYTVALGADGRVQVSGPDGVDLLSNVELLSFSNGTIAAPKFPHWIASSDLGTHPAGYAPMSTGDFNHDGTSDILWFNSANLDVDLWKIGNGKWAGSVDIGTHPAGYNLTGAGDFNHDGTPDLLWYNPANGAVDIWKIANGQWAGSVDVGQHPSGAQALGGGDFNGDGTSDVLWYNAATNDAEVWLIQNGQWAGSVDIGAHPAGSQPLASVDIDHDGTMDLLWYNPTTRDIDVWKIANGHWAASIDIGAHPAGYAPARLSDFNNDGSPDVLWFNPTSGDAELWLLQNGHWAASVDLGTHPTGWAPAGLGDFNHDGNADILWRDPATNHVEAWLLSNS